jgi:hypothetical protein
MCVSRTDTGGADIALPVTATSNTTETLISLAEFGIGLRAGLFRPRSNCDRISRTDAGKLHRASSRVPRGLHIEQLPITQAEGISRLSCHVACFPTDLQQKQPRYAVERLPTTFLVVKETAATRCHKWKHIARTDDASCAIRSQAMHEISDPSSSKAGT